MIFLIFFIDFFLPMLQTSTVYYNYYLILFHMMSSVLQGIMFVTLFRYIANFWTYESVCQKTVGWILSGFAA